MPWAGLLVVKHADTKIGITGNAKMDFVSACFTTSGKNSTVNRTA